MRRACRILPIYFVVLAAFIVVVGTWSDKIQRFPWLLNDTIPFWAHATFTQNILMGFQKTFGAPYWFGPTWSLAVEEQFYLVLPLIVYFAPRRLLPWLFGGLIVLAPVLRSVTASQFHCYVQAPWRADSLIMGALLAWCVRNPTVLQFLSAQRQRLYLILGGLFAGAVLMTWRGPQLGGAIDHFALAALYATIILIAYIDADGWLARCLRCRVLVWLGTLSYGIYLFHQPVSAAVHIWWRGAIPKIYTLQDSMVTCVALAITLLLAACSFRFFERRFIEFGHSVRYRTEAQQTPLLVAEAQPMGK